MPYFFNDQSFNDTITNNIVSFEQLGPGLNMTYLMLKKTNHCQHADAVHLFDLLGLINHVNVIALSSLHILSPYK